MMGHLWVGVLSLVVGVVATIGMAVWAYVRWQRRWVMVGGVPVEWRSSQARDYGSVLDAIIAIRSAAAAQGILMPHYAVQVVDPSQVQGESHMPGDGDTNLHGTMATDRALPLTTLYTIAVVEASPHTAALVVHEVTQHVYPAICYHDRNSAHARAECDTFEAVALSHGYMVARPKLKDSPGKA